MSAKKKILTMLLLFVAFEGLYQLLLYFERTKFPQFPVSIIILFLIVSGVLIAFIILNRGFDRDEITPESFDPSLSLEKRRELSDKYNANRKKAKTLMLVFVPLSLVLCIDLIDLCVITPLIPFFETLK